MLKYIANFIKAGIGKYHEIRENTSAECIKCMNKRAFYFGTTTAVVVGFILLFSKILALIVLGFIIFVFSILTWISEEETVERKELNELLECNCQSINYIKLFLNFYLAFLIALFLILW
jgi:hypothetical protein